MKCALSPKIYKQLFLNLIFQIYTQFLRNWCVCIKKIKRSCKQLRDLAIVEFLYTTGVRISELCSLNRDDVCIRDKEIIVSGKGAKERAVYMTPVSCMYLKEYLT